MSWTGPCVTAVATNGGGKKSGSFVRSLAPPPVPPRPSKNLIQEALARTRNHPKNVSSPAVPNRPAPPPPPLLKSTLVKVTPDNNTTIFVSKDIHSTVHDNTTVIYQQNINIESEKNSKNDENRLKFPENDNTISVRIHENNNKFDNGDDDDDDDDNNVEENNKFTVFSVVNHGELYEKSNNEIRNSCDDDPLGHSHSISLQMLREISKVSSADEDSNVFDGGLLVDKVQEKVPVLTQAVWPTGQHKHGVSTSANVLRLDTAKRTVSVTSSSSEKDALVEALIDELRETSQQRTAQNPIEIDKTEMITYNQSDTFCQINIEPPPPSISSSSTSTSVSDSSYCCCEKQRKPIRRPRDMTSLHGLPPLPKSLSGINLFETASKSTGQLASSSSLNPVDEVETPRYRSFANSKAGSSGRGPPLPPTRTYQNGVQPEQPPPIRPRKTGLDAQLAILRKEMYGLRQLDLSLLSQLWSLNESIQEFRQLLQEQEEQAALSPPSPSSADEGDEFYSPLTQPRMQSVGALHAGLHPVPEQFRLTSSSSQSSIEYGDV